MGTLPLPLDLKTAQDLEDMTRDALRLLLPVTVLASWAWAGPTMLLTPWYFLPACEVLVLTLTVIWLSSMLRWRRLSQAVFLYLLGLTADVTIVAFTYRAPTAFCLYIVVLLVAPMLAGPGLSFTLAGASVALVLVAGVNAHLPIADVAMPMLLIILTALTSWASSRRLHTALAWTINMTRQAQSSAEEARERRAEVRSILKSLEEAYVRLERTNQALIFAREAADKAYRFKTEFVANVSHELRTPLNLIVGFSEMMAMSPESYKGVALPSQYRGDVMAIYHSAHHLSDLINDVLDLSQIEAGRMPLNREPADLAEIILEAVEIVRGLVQAKGLRLELELPATLPPLRLDRTRIRQVLLNLLSNASRFTDRGSISVHVALEEGAVRVRVRDSGRGIAADKIARAFEAFSQLDEQQAREGSGLGLAVSRRFIELHGGTMEIASVLGQGTTVGFVLPLPERGKDEQIALIGPVRSAPPQAGQRVLVLHDEPRALALLERYVDGYQFVSVSNAAQTAAAIQEGPIAAMIVDSEWGGDWKQAAASLGLDAQVPVIACPLPNLHRLGVSLGATDYLTKPVTRDSLLGALAHLPQWPRSVLIVDDDLNLVRLLGRILEGVEPAIEVFEAANGREGLAAMRAQPPAVVLLDLLMPEMDGYAFLAEMSRDPALAATPVIVMSAYAGQQEDAPLSGELRLARASGLQLSEVLQALPSLLGAVTSSAAAARANV